MTLPVTPASDEALRDRSTDPAPAPAAAARFTFLTLLLTSIGLVGSIALAVWQPIVLGAALAATVVRYYERLTARLKGRKTLAAVVMTLGVLFLVVIPLGVLLSFVVVQGTQAVKLVTDLLHGSHGLDDIVAHLPVRIQGPVQRILEVIPIDLEKLSEQLAAGSRWAATTLGGLLSTTSRLIFDMGLTLIAFYVFLTDGPGFVRWLAHVLPLKERQTYEVFNDFRMMSKAIIGANLIVGGSQAVLASIAYFIAPIPHALFFGLLTFIASFVPSVGTALVTVPLTVIMLLAGHPWWAAFLGVWTIGLVGGVDNIVRPMLLRGAGHIHGAVVFFSLIGGIGVFGPMGIIVGPLSITFVLAMVRLWQRDFNPQTRRAESVVDDRPQEKTDL